LDVDVRLWHLVSACCVGGTEVLFAVSSVVTGEAEVDYAVLRLVASAMLVCVLWALSRRAEHHAVLIVWPLFLMAVLAAGSRATPQAAQLCIGTFTLAFVLVGLTQPRWVILALLVPGAFADARILHIATGQLTIRLVITVIVWAFVAGLPGWLVDRLHSTSREMVALAGTDQLTGLANRRTWDERVDWLVDEVAQHGRGLVVGLLDLDHFKAYNDANGHIAGDELLREVAGILSGSVRSGDVVARWGGEEFAFALPRCNRDKAVEVAERMRGAMPDGETCSIGIATWQRGDTVDTITQRADQALYEAKENGRNRVVAHMLAPL